MARTTNNSNRKYRRLTFQALEGRAMMAGDVAVSILNGDLRVTGDSQDNEVAIVQTIQQGQPVAGSFFVGGVNGTTVNGGGGQTFTGVTRDFSINLVGGADRITLGDNVATNHFTVPNDLRIDTGSGADTLALNRITVRDDTFITTGIEADRIDISGVFGVAGVDNGQNDMTINTGDGSDVMRLVNIFVRRDLNINTGTDSGSDLIDMAIGNIGRDVNIATGAGIDTVAVQQMGVNGDLRIDTGTDRDVVVISDSECDELFVSLGTGRDQLEIFNTFGRRATLDGGADADTLREGGNGFRELFQRISF